METWLPINGFPHYEVSDLGRVRSRNPKGMKTIDSGGVLRPYLHKGGYPMVQLYADSKSYKRTVHSLVCEAFHGPKPTPRHEVAHADGKPPNVRADNLSWKLPIDNNADKLRHGTHFNSGQFRRRLTDDDVREIRRLAALGRPQTAIAKQFGVWQTMVSHIKTGKRFRHVT